MITTSNVDPCFKFCKTTTFRDTTCIRKQNHTHSHTYYAHTPEISSIWLVWQENPFSYSCLTWRSVAHKAGTFRPGGLTTSVGVEGKVSILVIRSGQFSLLIFDIDFGAGCREFSASGPVCYLSTPLWGKGTIKKFRKVALIWLLKDNVRQLLSWSAVKTAFF